MGGKVAVTIIKDDIIIRMSRWTNWLSLYFLNPEFINGGKMYAEFIDRWNGFCNVKPTDDDFDENQMAYEYAKHQLFAPIDYGLTIVDFDKKEIHSCQGYEFFEYKILRLSGLKAEWDETQSMVKVGPKEEEDEDTSGLKISFHVFPNEDDLKYFGQVLNGPERFIIEASNFNDDDVFKAEDYDSYGLFKKDIMMKGINEWGMFKIKVNGFKVINYDSLETMYEFVKTNYSLTGTERHQWDEAIELELERSLY